MENWHIIYYSSVLHNNTDIIIIIKWNVLFVEKNIFGDFFVGSRISDRRHVNTVVNTTENVIYRYLHIELIWRLLMVQCLQNNVIMKWTTHFIRFTGWIPLNYGSTTTRPIIAHCKKTPMSSVIFHSAIHQTSNIIRTPSFDLPTDEFSKRVSIIRRTLY